VDLRLPADERRLRLRVPRSAGLDCLNHSSSDRYSPARRSSAPPSIQDRHAQGHGQETQARRAQRTRAGGNTCLNDALTPRIPRELKFKIYVSALTQINLDDHKPREHHDNRILRRMVRDYQLRGHSAQATLTMWPSVQSGEPQAHLPFQTAPTPLQTRPSTTSSASSKSTPSRFCAPSSRLAWNIPRPGACSPSSTTSRLSLR